MNWFIDCITKKYANFSGRARRTEYWMFALFVAIIWVVLFVLASLSDSLAGIMMVVGIIVLLGLFIPNLAVTVRRLHDTGKSGWWILINFIPFGWIILLIFCCLDSTPGSNQYGENPKGL